jgi:hypothetical protein
MTVNIKKDFCPSLIVKKAVGSVSLSQHSSPLIGLTSSGGVICMAKTKYALQSWTLRLGRGDSTAMV